MSDTKFSLNQNLRKLLETKGLTQTELSSFLQTPVTTVNSWLRNYRRIPVETIPLICEFLNVTPNCLFNDTPVNTEDSLTSAEADLLHYYRQLSLYNQGIILGEVKALHTTQYKTQLAARTDVPNNVSTSTNIDIVALQNAVDIANTLDD